MAFRDAHACASAPVSDVGFVGSFSARWAPVAVLRAFVHGSIVRGPADNARHGAYESRNGGGARRSARPMMGYLIRASAAPAQLLRVGCWLHGCIRTSTQLCVARACKWMWVGLVATCGSIVRRGRISVQRREYETDVCVRGVQHGNVSASAGCACGQRGEWCAVDNRIGSL